jgi:hypothetical protein
MRGASVALLLLSVLGTCLPTLAQGPGAAPPHVETRTWSGEATVSRAGACTAVCSGSPRSPLEFPVAANERVVSFHARLVPNEDQALLDGGVVEPDAGKPVTLRASCLGGEAAGCPAGSATEVRARLPAEVSADGLEWPLGAGLALGFVRDEPSFLLVGSPFGQGVLYEAAVSVFVDPSVKLPDAGEALQPFAIDTTTGVCLPLAEAECRGGPAQVLALGNVAGSLTRLHGAVTWDAASPTARTLRLTFRCTLSESGPLCNGGAGFPLEYDGPSPLAFDTGDVSWQHVPAGAWIEVSVEESSLEPVRHVEGFTRQPFHLEGEFVSAV